MTGSAAPSPAHYNQQVYQRLKMALSLDLRRQLFIAVCDDLNLRNRLAGQLHRELGQQTADQVAAEIERSGIPLRQETLVSLKLDLTTPSPIVQVERWLRNQGQDLGRPGRGDFGGSLQGDRPMPSFQILGIEQLTRQPASVQQQFLNDLRGLDRQLPALRASLVLWVTRPWYETIRKSAPECWQWCSGLFEFIAEPLPLLSDERPETSAPEMDALTPEGDALVSTYASTPVASPRPAPRSSQDSPASPVPATASTHAAPPSTAAHSAEPLGDPAGGSGTAAEQNGVNAYDAAAIIAAQASALTAIQAASTPAEEVPSASPAAELASASAGPDSVAAAASAASLAQAFTNPAEQEEAQLLARIELLRQADGSSETLALAYLELGRFYRRRLEQGDSTQDFIRYAIVAYEQVLEWLCFNDPAAETSSLSWPDTLNDLGTLYWMAARQPESPEMGQSYIKLAIQTYRLGLKNTDAEANPRAYAMLQNNLGTVHSDFAHHEAPEDNLAQAIAAYKEALRFRQPESAPIKYASTQNNLGTAYWHLAQHENAPENLKWAIAAYSQAAQYYNPDEQPDSYAMIQNNLGTAYWNLAQLSPGPNDAAQPSSAEAATESNGHFMAQEWLLLAVNSYNNALRFRTLQVAPGSYASTQNNLGTAYWQLANQGGQTVAAVREYLQLAIRAYDAALKAVQFLEAQQLTGQLNFDPHATHSNAGLVHYQLATDCAQELAEETQQEHLDHALTHQVQAMAGWQAKPELYDPALAVLVQTIQHCYATWGSSGQNRALGLVPGQLLPELLPKL